MRKALSKKNETPKSNDFSNPEASKFRASKFKPTKEAIKLSSISEDANDEKSILIAQASHEIKTPLASILGFADSLLSYGHLDAEDRADVMAIKRQSEYMRGLICDLLDLTKIEGHRLALNYEILNPVQLIEELLQAVKVRYQDKNIKLNLNYLTKIPQWIEVDPIRFHQVLNQVLTNAFNFTFEGQINIDVEYIVDETKKPVLSIKVQDSGIGMSSQTKKRIFKPFMRGDFLEVQNTPGTGLGLTLARMLMQNMSGDLALVKTEVGIGSLFEITLNLKDSQTPCYSAEKLRAYRSLNEAEKDAESLDGRQILVVDDSDDLRLLMRKYLNKAGAEVDTSENGAEAVAKALHKDFDFILMDIRMPVMNGYEATQLLRESGYKRPIIALTAQATEEDQFESEQKGFTAFLSKPINMSQLKEIMRSY